MVNDLDRKVLGAGGGGGGDVEPDTLFTSSTGKGIFVFSEGPTGGLATGDGKSIYLNDVALIDSMGSATANGVSWTWRSGLPDQQYIDGFPSAVAFQNVGVNVKQATPYAITIANGSDNYDAAYVVVSIPQLVFKSAKGNLRKTDVGFQIQVRANGGSWVTQHNVNFTGKASSEWEGTYRVELPVGGSPWNVRLVRTIPDSDDGPRPNGEMRSSETHFARYATITDGKFTYRNTAVLGVQFDAKRYGGSIPSVKVMMDGIKCYVPSNYNPVTRQYSGLWNGTFKVAVTDNPIWIYHDLLINNRYGLGQDFNPTDDPETAFVDKWALYSLGQYCDELVSNGKGGTEPRFTINCQITNKSEAYDLLQNIISSVNGMLYFSAEKVVAVADRPQTVVDGFTQADVEDGIFEYSGTALKTRHSVCIVSYKDPDNLYKTSNVIYEDPEYMQEIGRRVTEVTAFGCTSRAQALRLARWTLRTERSQTQTVTFKTGLRGGMLTPGQIIKIFDDYKTGTRTGGRILEVGITGNRRTFKLDQAVNVNTSDRLVYVDETGFLHDIAFDQAFSNTDTVTIPNTTAAPIEGAMFGVIYASLDGQQFRVLATEEDDDGKYVVVALQHDANKFAFIDSNVVLDDPRTSVLDSSAVSPVRNATQVSFFETVSGARSKPKVTVSWEPPRYATNYPDPLKRNQLDDRVREYELQFKTPLTDYITVQRSTSTDWTSGELEPIRPPETDPVSGQPIPDPENPQDLKYGARVRAIDSLGRTSGWTIIPDFYVTGEQAQPDPITGLIATPILNGVALNWTNPNTTSFKNVEVKSYEILPVGNDPGTLPSDIPALLASLPVEARVVDDFYIKQGITHDNPIAFFLQTTSHNGDTKSDVVWIQSPRGKLTVEDIPGGSVGVPEVDVLPTLTEDYDGPSIVYLKTDGRLWHIVAGEWKPMVDDSTVIPTVPSLPASGEDGQTILFQGQLYIWRNNQWELLIPPVGEIDGLIETVSSLPATADNGTVVFLTTDGKLYRRHNGAWVSSTAAADITGEIASSQIASLVASKISGTLAATQIPGLDASKINSGTLGYAFVPVIGNDKIAADAIRANHIQAGAVTAGKLAANSVIAGTIAAGIITANEIASNAITAVKIDAGAVTAVKVAAGAITTDKLEAGAVTAAKIAAGTITANELAANSITSAKIAANQITAVHIAANAVTADSILAGAITAAKISVSTLAAINANLGAITAGSLNINNRFVVTSLGEVTISSGASGARLVLTSSQLQVYDANRLRVRIGVW